MISSFDYHFVGEIYFMLNLCLKEVKEMDGFFLVDKPKGITSQAVVNRIKKKFNLKKCGHTGTLDPDTTGLLVVGCDNATKLIKYLNEHDKCYETTIVFDFETSTLDISGKIVRQKAMDISIVAVEEALKKLKDSRFQIPPMVSAIKVQGKKLYEYERNNIQIEVSPRPIKIYELTPISTLRMVDNFYEIDIKVACSKGFYVRSLARDLGHLLGGFATMKSLRRIKSGNFVVSDSIPLDSLKASDIILIEDIFKDFALYECNDFEANLVYNGVVLDERQISTDRPFYVKNKGRVIAIYEPFEIRRYKPVVIFKEEAIK